MYVYEAMRAGARGFMLKNVPPDQLAAAVRTIARRLIEQIVQRPRPGGEMLELGALTEREVDILRHIARGLSNAEIAESLVVSAATVWSRLGERV